MITLWRTAQDAEARVERAVQAETERLARVVRERLADAAAVFAAVPRTAQFEVAAGALVVPPQVQWLDEPPDPLELLPPAVWATRREAREAEFVAGQPTRALELLRAAAGATAEVLGRRNLQLTLGFAAHRAGRQDLLAELLPVLIEPLEPAWPCAADTALLLATCGRDVPAWVDAALATLAPERARAVVARVAELHPRAKSTALELAAEAQAARAVLVAVRGELPALLAAAAPQQLRADQLLLWWPAGPDAGRRVPAPARSLIADLNRLSASFNDISTDPDLSLTALNRVISVLIKATNSTALHGTLEVSQLALVPWPDVNYPGDPGFHGPDGTDWHQMIGSLRYAWNQLLGNIYGPGR